MRTAAVIALLLLAGPANAASRSSVLVELFTAQGCGPCAEANAHIDRLSERTDVLALTFSVDYWDYLGWTDTFARPEFTERQRAYVTRLKLREPYTPQVVVDGREETQARRGADLEPLIRAARAARPSPPDMRFVSQRRVDVGSGRAPRGGAEVWLVRYDPRADEVVVRAGDNRGETVVQRNVVRRMERLGVWRGRPQAYRLPPSQEDGLRTAVIVQHPRGGRVIGVARPES
jgi:hypothetical protein